MKSKFLVLLLCIFSITVWGQAPIRTCNTCGKVISTCPYKGNHPVAPKKCGVCGRTNCPQNGHHKKCPTCGKYDFQCRYNCKHPVSKNCDICGKSNCAQNGRHEKCSHCGEYDFKCDYNMNHPKCSDCNKLIGAKYQGCLYNGTHPVCEDCDKKVGGESNASCSFGGKHTVCEECHRPIGGLNHKSCPYDGNHPSSIDVSFACNAPGAELYVDEVPVGALPLTESLIPGSYELIVKAPGYKDYSQQITVNENNREFILSMQEEVPPAKGTVTDKHGNPLTGASIIVKGTVKGAMADRDGCFSINDVKNGEVLRTSFIGYKAQEQIWDGTPMNIVLKEAPPRLRVGLSPSFQVGNAMAIGGSLGLSLKGANLEVGMLMGLCDQIVDWTEGTLIKQEALSFLGYTARVGYDYQPISHLCLTPQIGTNIVTLKGDLSKSYASAATLGCRMTYKFARHFGISLTPEYGLTVKKSETYQLLTDSDVKDIAGGFKLKFAFHFFF